MNEIIKQIGITLGILCTLSGIAEGYKYVFAGRTLWIKKSSKNYSRKRELWAIIFLTPQLLYAYWGVFFPTFHPAWVWVIIITVTYIGTGTLLYLACKFKRKDGRWSWPTWRSI